MQKINLFTALCFVLLISCEQNKRTSADGIIVEVNSTQSKALHLSDFIESVQYVTLESSSESILRRISRLFVLDDRFLVVGGHEIKAFDHDGKYLYKISKRGRGAGEYLGLNNVMYDARNNHIIVYDSYSRKLSFYTITGEFIRGIDQFSDGMLIRDIENLPNGNFLCFLCDHGDNSPPNTTGLWEVDSTGQFKQWIWQTELVHPAVGDGCSLSQLSNGKICLRSLESEEDFHYDKGTLTKIISYNVINGKTSKDFAGLNNDTFVTHWVDGVRFIARMYTQHKGDYIFTGWTGEEDKHFYTLYSKKDNSFSIGSSIDFTLSDGSVASGTVSTNGTAAMYTVESNLSDVIVVPIQPEMLLHERNTPNSVAYKATLEMTEQQILNANPVLQFLHIKQ